jgi:predicted thioesterase
MKSTLEPGLSRKTTVEVDERRVVTFLEARGGPRVYATPSLIADLEFNCRDLLLSHLDEGEDSVGTGVNIEHRAPTPEGMKVVHSAELTRIDGRHCTFQVTAHDGRNEIGRGEHHRLIVDVARFASSVVKRSR